MSHLFLIATVVIAVPLSVYCLANRSVRGALPFMAFLLSAEWWAFCNTMATLVSGQQQGIWLRAQFVGIMTFPPALLFFAFEYTEQGKWLIPRNAKLLGALLSVMPILTVIVVFTNVYSLMWIKPFTYETIRYAYGPWHSVIMLYNYPLLAFALFIMARALVNSQGMYRWRLGLILAGFVPPLIANVLHSLAVITASTTPNFFIIPAITTGIAMFRFQFFNLVPVARDTIIEQMKECVVILNTKDMIVDVNPAAERLLGLSKAMLTGWTAARAFSRWPVLIESYTKKVQTNTITLINDDVYELRISELSKKDGTCMGYLVILHDITAYERAKRAAESANRAKSVFLSNMSHELRTPLNAILGFAEILFRDQTLNPSQQKYIAIINRSGRHLLALINDVLEFSKIESGKTELHEEDFDLPCLLSDLEEMLRSRAESRGLALTFNRAVDIPRYIRADQNKLREVLINLLGNAIKFTSVGGVTLCAKPGDLCPTPGKQNLLFEVSDTGIGIAPEERETIFDAFVQASNGHFHQQGTGLGLAISRQFVRIMGGELTVRSVTGEGSTFTFNIQVALANAVETEKELPKEQMIGLEPGQHAADGCPYRLLIAEDVEENRILLRELLQPLGVDVREAANGREAVEIWKQWKPHLIWMDMRMPVMDGKEATHQIKATLAPGQSTIVVAVTASAFAEDRRDIMAAGCDDFVSKPICAADVWRVMQKHLGMKSVHVTQKQATSIEKIILTQNDLAVLDKNWLVALCHAADTARAESVIKVIEQIEPEQARIAGCLRALVAKYQYDRISDLVNEALAGGTSGKVGA